MTEAPFSGNVEPLGITIKYGKGYEDSWITIRGTADMVRQTLIETFELDPEESKGLSTAALVLNATQEAHAMGLLGRGLGARAIPADRGGRGRSNPDAWMGAKAADKPAEDPAKVARETAIRDIGEAASVDALKRWWAENQEVFKDPEVAAAYKAKGKSLQAAGK